MENTLKLKDFVKEALIDINTGVKEAKDSGVSITHGNYGEYGRKETLPKSQKISFDLSVSIEKENGEQKERSVGGAISVISGKVGKGKNSSLSETVENRIQFSVEAFLGLEVPKKEEL